MMNSYRVLLLGQMPVILPGESIPVNIQYWLGMLLGGKSMLREEQLRRQRGDSRAVAWVVQPRKRVASWLLRDIDLKRQCKKTE